MKIIAALISVIIITDCRTSRQQQGLVRWSLALLMLIPDAWSVHGMQREAAEISRNSLAVQWTATTVGLFVNRKTALKAQIYIVHDSNSDDMIVTIER